MPFIGHDDVSGEDHMATIRQAADDPGTVPVPVTLFGVRVEVSDVAPHLGFGVERIIFRMPPASSNVVLPLVTEAASIGQALS